MGMNIGKIQRPATNAQQPTTKCGTVNSSLDVGRWKLVVGRSKSLRLNPHLLRGICEFGREGLLALHSREEGYWLSGCSGVCAASVRMKTSGMLIPLTSKGLHMAAIEKARMPPRSPA